MPYKWPQKIARYDIRCSFQRLLVAKHEREIEWSGRDGREGIESPEALNRHIREVMLPRLKERISVDGEKNHYCRNLNLDRMLANPAPHLVEARGIRETRGEAAAQTFLLDHINGQKRQVFERWWAYVTEENGEYFGYPAFQYLVLRPVIDSSTEKDTRSPVPVDAEGLAHLFDRMKAGRVLPERKILSLLCELTAFGGASSDERPQFGTSCTWVVIRQADSNAATRVSALSQGSGWCVASSSMASSYLSRSDFHLLVEAGRAVVALRVSNESVVEAQGKGNRDPAGWWPRILLYIASHGLSLSHRAYDANLQALEIGKQLRRGMADVRALKSLLTEQPAKVQFLDQGWVDGLSVTEVGENNPFRLIVQEAWTACIETDPLSAGLTPSWMILGGELLEILIKGWCRLLMVDASAFTRVPSKLLADPGIREASVSGWVSSVGKAPLKWSECPVELRSEGRIRDALIRGWMSLLERSPLKWSDCFGCLKNDSVGLQTLGVLSARFGQRYPLLWSRHLGLLLDDFGGSGDLVSRWVNLLQIFPSAWSHCPEDFRTEHRVLGALKDGWLALLKMDDGLLGQQPVGLLSSEEAAEAVRQGRVQRLAAVRQGRVQRLATALQGQVAIPENFQRMFEAIGELPELKRAMLQLWRNNWAWAHGIEAVGWLRRHPWVFDKLPEPQQRHAFLREEAAIGWRTLIKENKDYSELVSPSLRLHPELVDAMTVARQQIEEESNRDLRKVEQERSVEASNTARRAQDQVLERVKGNLALSDEEVAALGITAAQPQVAKSILNLRMEYWTQAVKKNWQVWVDVPASLRNHKNVLKAMRESLGPCLRDAIRRGDEDLWNQLQDCYRQDEAVQRVRRYASLPH